LLQTLVTFWKKLAVFLQKTGSFENTSLQTVVFHVFVNQTHGFKTGFPVGLFFPVWIFRGGKPSIAR